MAKDLDTPVLMVRTNSENLQKLFNFDVVDTLRCAILGAVVTPPNFMWQNFLERKFPSKKAKVSQESSKKQDLIEESEGRLSKSNTIAKFFLDQTIGCWINTLAFLLLFGFLKGKGALEIENEVKTVGCFLPWTNSPSLTDCMGSGPWSYRRIDFGLS